MKAITEQKVSIDLKAMLALFLLVILGAILIIRYSTGVPEALEARDVNFKVIEELVAYENIPSRVNFRSTERIVLKESSRPISIQSNFRFNCSECLSDRSMLMMAGINRSEWKHVPNTTYYALETENMHSSRYKRTIEALRRSVRSPITASTVATGLAIIAFFYSY